MRLCACMTQVQENYLCDFSALYGQEVGSIHVSCFMETQMKKRWICYSKINV